LYKAFLALLALTVSATAQQTSTAPTPDWSYYGKTGPSSWGRLSPVFAECSHGKMESPIDIRKAKLDKALTPIEFHYLSGPITLVNNGHTVQGVVAPGSYIVVDGTRYDLQQFHFHHPAEHYVSGKAADVEIHLVHKSAAGTFAVIAVLVKEGQVNGSLAELWPSLPGTVGASAKFNDPFDPRGLLPSDPGYWEYIGSLTAPPCTEGVHWFVMEQSTELSHDQLDTFGKLYPFNARQVQPLDGRKIEASE
jgi:carbonic anhydrase